MHTLDWLVVVAYLLGIMGLASVLSLRASASADSYLVADRKLPWWVIGVSDVASDAGGDAFWIAVFFSGAFMGFYQVWWIGFVVAVPLSILWARYWRRLRLLSPWEIFEVRYGGRAAGAIRGFSAVYAATVTSVVILAYVLQAFAQIMSPFLGWEPTTVLIVFGGASALYTLMSGLLGVAYSDVPQFILLMVGRIILAVVAVSAAGGLDVVLDTVEHIKGVDFLRPYPPSSDAMYGDYAIDPTSMFALMLAGLLGVASTGNASVQRSLAARSERDAALGQMLAAVLSLVVRIAPLVLIGLAGIAMFGETEVTGTDVWAGLVQEHAVPGLLGLIMVGIVAGYMSTIDTFLNFLTAGLFNDFYRRHVRPQAGPREQVAFCRAATVLIAGIAVLWAYVLIGNIDSAWLRFMNTVFGLFVMPTLFLRWVWWRMNVWGEVVALIAGFPLAYLIWFPLGFSDRPYWIAFLLLAGTGWLTVTLVTLLTPPETDEVLDNFYTRVRPPGFWGPVARRVYGGDVPPRQRAELMAELSAAVAGLFFCTALVLGLTSFFARDMGLFAGMMLMLAVSGFAYFNGASKAEAIRRSSETTGDQG